MAAAALTAPRVAEAAPFDVGGRDWEGLADFVQAAREELGEARVTTSGTVDYDTLKREDGVVLIHPTSQLDVESLAAFMKAGGRVVLLDDYGSGDALLRHFGIERTPMPEHPAEMLRQNPSFAIAEPASAHPVVREVTRLVTNHATGLSHPELSPVLAVHALDRPDVLLALAGAVGDGRLLAVGDASVVMNAMLRFPGNRAFARGLVRYAVDDDRTGARGGRLHLLAGAFAQKGSAGGEEGLAKKWREAVRDARGALASAEKDGLPPTALYALAVLAGLGLVLWVGSRAGRTHRPVVPRYTRPVPVAAHGGLAGHAAVVGAPHTPRALAMMELKAAVEEHLASLLGLDQVPAQDTLRRAVAEAGLLDAEGERTLAALLLRMATIETMVLSRRLDSMDRVRDREVVETAAVVARLLGEAERRAALPPEARA